MTRSKITIESCLRVVSAQTGIEVHKIKSSDRSRSISMARAVVSYLALKLTDKSSTQVGAHLKKDHSSILYANYRIRRERKIDKNLDDLLTRLEEELVPCGE